MSIMESKKILLSILIIGFALVLVCNVSAADNESISDNNLIQEDSVYQDIELEQRYGPTTIIHKDEIFNVFLTVRNTGNNTYNNLLINYPLPKGLEVLIYPVEYDGTVWTIDTLYPGESNTLTLVCRPLISGTTYEFQASLDGINTSEMDVYCEGSIPTNNTDNNGQTLDAINNEISILKNTANPIYLLFFALFLIPYFRLRD